MLSDHTAYWENLDEFVPLVIRELDGVANTGLMRNSAACRQLSWMRKKRKTRALLLRYCRMLVFLSAFVPMLIRWPQVVEFGKVGVSTYLPNAVVDKLTSVNSSVAETVGTKTALAVQDFTYGAMGVAAVSGIAFIWYCMMLMIWRSWDQRQMIEGFPSGASPPMLHVSSFSLKASAARIKRNFPQWAQQGCIVFMAGLSLYAAVRCGWFGGYHQLLFDLASAQHQISAAIDLFVRWLILACLGVAGMEMAVGGLILVFALAMLGYVSVRMWYNRTHKVPVKARQEEATRSQRT